MSNARVLHILWVIAYVGAAATVALLFPRIFQSLAPPIAHLWGAVVLLGGLFVHEAARHRQRERVLARAIVKQNRGLADAEREARESRLELQALRESFDAASGRLSADAMPEIAQIRDEMQLLRKMIDKVVVEADAAEAHGMPARMAAGGEGTVWPLARTADETVPWLRAARVERPSQKPAPESADLAVLQTIRDALSADRVELYLQQVVSLPERQRRYFECYSRLRTVKGELLFPQQYMPVAERIGLTGTIDNVLLLRCVQLIRKLQQRNLDIGFFCNISPSTLKDSVFLKEFASLLANSRSLGRGLVFEFRQSDFALIEAGPAGYLDRLAGAGFRFSIDHVTTLDVDLDIRALAERHVRFLKIPGPILVAAAAGTSPVPLREIQERLRVAGIELVAEKIETKAVLRGLEGNGVTLGQGYLLGEPTLSQER